MKNPISIISINSISALGHDTGLVQQHIADDASYISKISIKNKDVYVAELPSESKLEIEKLSQSNPSYKNLDPTVLYAIYTARQAVLQAGWKNTDSFGINLGSSRGATTVTESHHSFYLNHEKVSPLASPVTTLGNISSWVAQDLQSNGPDISHSITCSTALHSVLNGVAWINSGMCDKFLVGGSEAPLTDFTIEQMRALKIYAPSTAPSDYPCQSLNTSKKKNSMVLGEGASVACLEQGIKNNAMALINGVGYATEIITHNASISTNADCFRASMQMAIADINPNEVDVIITHTPGTIKGDSAEINAINSLFGKSIPTLTTNKWKVGHTLGTSGMLSMELGVHILQNQSIPLVPFIACEEEKKSIKNVLINAVGFGGNAVSILICKP